MYKVGGSYAPKLDYPEALVSQILRDLNPRTNDFDTIVATGTSGMMIAPIIAMIMRKHMVAVRKPGENSHSGGLKLQGIFGERWIFLDDFIATGNTLRRVVGTVEQEGPKNAEFIGAYLYEGETSEFRSPQSLSRMFF